MQWAYNQGLKAQSQPPDARRPLHAKLAEAAQPPAQDPSQPPPSGYYVAPPVGYYPGYAPTALPPQQQALLLVFGALPPAVLNYIFAERYHQEPEVVASMVLIGNVAGLLFLAIALAMVLP